LLCVVVCCCLLDCVAVCCSVLQCVAVCCSVLQCVAVCCSALQCVAVCLGYSFFILCLFIMYSPPAGTESQKSAPFCKEHRAALVMWSFIYDLRFWCCTSSRHISLAEVLLSMHIVCSSTTLNVHTQYVPTT